MFIFESNAANIKLISVTFDVFHFPISGKEHKEEHPKNKKLIFWTALVSQIEISGTYSKEDILQIIHLDF